MSALSPALQDLVCQLRSRTLEDRKRLLHLLETMDGDREEALSQMCGIAHRLAGSAGTFGFAQLSDCAAALEDSLSQEWRGPAPLRAQVQQLAAAIDKAFGV
jgi:HPt (histidine-containing phosphotransfer) domain-containing protein